MQGLCHAVQFRNQAVAHAPMLDHLGHVRVMLEAAEKPDCGFDVIRMITPMDEASQHDGHVRIILLQFDACAAVTQRHLDLAPISQIIGLVVRHRVVFDAVYSILLRLGPQPFAADVGANGGQDIHLDLNEEDKAKDERNKQGHDQVDPADGGNARCSYWPCIRYFSHDVSTAVPAAQVGEWKNPSTSLLLY